MKFDVIGSTLVRCEGDDEIVVIPDGVMVITDIALTGCSSAKILKIPKSVVEIPLSACCYLNSLVGFVVAEDNSFYSSKDGVLFNKDRAILYQYPKGKPDTFYAVPEGVIIIHSNAFQKCTYLKCVHVSGVEIGEGAFTGCTSLTTAIILNGVTNIGYCAFSDCTSLIGITIPDSVTSVGDYAFANCISLVSAVISKGIKRIPSNTFDDCKKLKSMIVDVNTEISEDMLNKLAKLPKFTLYYQVD